MIHFGVYWDDMNGDREKGSFPEQMMAQFISAYMRHREFIGQHQYHDVFHSDAVNIRFVSVTY